MYEHCSPESMLYNTNCVSRTNPGLPYPYPGYPPAPAPHQHVVYSPVPPAPPYPYHGQYYTLPVPGHGYHYPAQLAPAAYDPPPKAKPNKSKAVKQTIYKVCGNPVTQNKGDNHRIFNIRIRCGRRDISNEEDEEEKEEEVEFEYCRRDMKDEEKEE
ncbi:PREDICTED: PRUPE_1G121600 [Prunus dulcis]|uniref:PREDICTED: PRUPE_1G121600 n=1 Tax=Prunus dulcis TaxID=3755 RepID=A0A5E4F9H9_PRUDU|nr:hypothetical protein L3X38_002188 [Prunus dulcis]VVA24615.1 PREDICTED: PRUPE_1G121600 [Prunus dulcis]